MVKTAQDMFWDWSLSVYAAPPVRSKCLRLQDEYGFDVNVILWLCWLASRRRSPCSAALDAVRVMGGNREARALSGLRKARREINFAAFQDASKTAKPLKDAILSAELTLEKSRQHSLSVLASDSTNGPRIELARYNFALLHAANAHALVGIAVFDALAQQIFS